jgi:hypothetical protein
MTCLTGVQGYLEQAALHSIAFGTCVDSSRVPLSARSPLTNELGMQRQERNASDEKPLWPSWA